MHPNPTTPPLTIHRDRLQLRDFVGVRKNLPEIKIAIFESFRYTEPKR